MRLRTMQKDDTIFVAGHKGLVGSAIVRRLKEDGYTKIITKDRSECDLTKSDDVRKLFEDIYTLVAVKTPIYVKENVLYVLLLLIIVFKSLFTNPIKKREDCSKVIILLVISGIVRKYDKLPDAGKIGFRE